MHTMTRNQPKIQIYSTTAKLSLVCSLWLVSEACQMSTSAWVVLKAPAGKYVPHD